MKIDVGPTGPAAAGGFAASAAASRPSLSLSRKKPVATADTAPLDQTAPLSSGRLKRASLMKTGKATSTTSGGGFGDRTCVTRPMTLRFSRVMRQTGQEGSSREYT